MRRLLGIAVTAVAASLGLAAPAQADVTPVTETGWQRWAGDDRYATAVAVSKATFTPDVGTVYLVSGEDFPDALAAGPVAGANQAPVLLVKKDSVPDVVAAELGRLNPGLVIVVGGSGVITDETMDAAAAAAGTDAIRFAGEDRYATAVRMAHALEDVPAVYIASGDDFADALAAGPAAGREAVPLLLTRTTVLPPATKDYLDGRPLSKIVIVGGNGAISPAVEASIRSLVPTADVVRYGGRDRFETASLLAEATWPEGADTVFYATGADFPDALAATPAAMVNDAPLLLTNVSCHPYDTTNATAELDPASKVALGGAAVTYSGDVTCGPEPSYPFLEDVDCADFSSQAEAQSWYNYWYPRVGDYFELDGDDDGKVCERWPPR